MVFVVYGSFADAAATPRRQVISTMPARMPLDLSMDPWFARLSGQGQRLRVELRFS
jgi:hypothetical protein